MSISDKLRIRPWLVELGTQYKCLSVEQLERLIAVVEADEALILRPDENGMPPPDCGYVRFSEIEAIRSALTALDEVLP